MTANWLGLLILAQGRNYRVQPDAADIGRARYMNGPFARLIFDSAGNLYSTTVQGGAVAPFYGTVFELMPKASGGWTKKVLHSFGAGNDGLQPYGGLVRDGSGSLYGATVFGGAGNKGTVFKITP